MSVLDWETDEVTDLSLSVKPRTPTMYLTQVELWTNWDPKVKEIEPMILELVAHNAPEKSVYAMKATTDRVDNVQVHPKWEKALEAYVTDDNS
jgi:hypothetical protein